MEIRFTISRSFVVCVVALAFIALAAVCAHLSEKNARLRRIVDSKETRIEDQRKDIEKLKEEIELTRQYIPTYGMDTSLAVLGK